MNVRLACLILLPLVSAAQAVLEIDATPQHTIDQRLFGQFMERPFGGETGPEGVVDPQGDLPSAVMQRLADMAIPLVRFPAGTDVDYTDWTYLIDNVPGRTNAMRAAVNSRNGHPVTARFGWHEYGRVADRLHWETIAVVNLLDGLARRRPLEEAALHAAGLVAYLNAPLGARLPAGMPDWPAIRARNGRPAPFAVRYIQLGNEWFIQGFRDAVRQGTGELSDADLAAWYIEVVRAHVRAIRAVDPKIEVIIDAEMGEGISRVVLADPELRREVRWATIHTYAPGPTAKWPERAHVGVPLDSVTAEELWRCWTASPGICDAAGQNQALGDERYGVAQALGYRLAMTEWNWTSWGMNELPAPAASRWRYAAGIGAAQFIHGLMRHGDAVHMACQSMLLGTGWNFAAIKVEADGRLLQAPQGQMTAFYAAHHGECLLPSKLTGVAIAPLAFKVGWSSEKPAVAEVDAVATGGDARLFAHLVNRGTKGLPVRIHVPRASRSARVHRLLPCGADDPHADHWFQEDTVTVPVANGWCQVELPGSAVVAVEFPAAAK